VFTLISSIAIGVAGGMLVFSLDKVDKVEKTIGGLSDRADKILDKMEKSIKKIEGHFTGNKEKRNENH